LRQLASSETGDRNRYLFKLKTIQYRRVLLEKLTVALLVKKSSTFAELEGSLPCSQEFTRTEQDASIVTI
jgi:hypothetical protein